MHRHSNTCCCFSRSDKGEKNIHFTGIPNMSNRYISFQIVSIMEQLKRLQMNITEKSDERKRRKTSGINIRFDTIQNIIYFASNNQ